MTRRKNRSALNQNTPEEVPKTRRSGRKIVGNDDDDSHHSQENDKPITSSKRASSGRQAVSKSAEPTKGPLTDSPRSKRGAKVGRPAVDEESVGRRSLRRPAPSSSVDDDEVIVPPVKKMRGRSSVSNSVDSSPSERSMTRSDAEQSKPGVKYEVQKVGKSENDVSTNSSGRQKPERTRKRRLVDQNDEEDSSIVSNDSPANSVNNENDTDNGSKKQASVNVSKEDNKRRKVATQKESVEKWKQQDVAKEMGDNEEDSKLSTHANGVKDAEVDWSDWKEGTSDGKLESLYNRVWKKVANNDLTGGNVQFSILTYNILAESLLKSSHYFKNISPAHWDQKHRHTLLMRELAAIEADVFCLQEVEEKYFQSLLKDLSLLGFHSIFAKSETPGRDEGLALCYRESRFRVVAEKSIPLARITDQLIEELNIPQENKQAIADYVLEPQMFQCVLLECRRSARLVCVGNVHISYAKHLKPDLRCAQIARSIWEAAKLLASEKRDIVDEMKVHSIPLILCGDLNSTPDSPLYQLCRDGYLNDTMLNALQRVRGIKFPSSESCVSLVNVLWKAFQHPIGNFKSSFYEAYNREPPLTQNLKGNKGCLDYVWFTHTDLSVEAVLPPRSGIIKDLEDVMPNADFPSDHLSLAVRFSFK